MANHTQHKTSITQIPEKLLAKILEYVVRPSGKRHLEPDLQRWLEADAVSVCRVSHQLRRLAEPLLYDNFHFTQDDDAVEEYNDFYMFEDQEELDPSLVPVPEFHILANNHALGKHIRYFDFGILDLALGTGILDAFKSAEFMAFVRDTYSPEFRLFLDQVLADAEEENEGSAEKYGHEHGIGGEMLTIFGLTLAHSVEGVALAYSDRFDESPLGKFFTFCSTQKSRDSHQSGHDTPDNAVPKINAPLSQLRFLELDDQYGHFCHTASDDTIQSLLLFPGLESCDVGHLRMTTHAVAADVSPNTELRHLSFACAEWPTRGHGGSSIFTRLLRSYPLLETLILPPRSYNPDLDTNENILAEPVAMDHNGFREALRHHAKHLRHLELGTWHHSEHEYDGGAWIGSLGSLREDLDGPIAPHLVLLKIRLTRLASMSDMLVDRSEKGIDGVDLSDYLPSGLRYLWTGHKGSASLDHKKALANMLHSARERMPRLEWVMVEMVSMTDEDPLAGLPLARSWTQTKLGMHHYLFRREGEKALQSADPQTQTGDEINVLGSGRHPKEWEREVIHTVIPCRR